MLIVILSCFLSSLPYFIYGPATHLLTKSELLEKPKHEFCNSVNRIDCEDAKLSATIPAVSIFFVASFINGFGYTAFYTIGTPYLDDNVKKKNSPLYFSAMFALRIFGPSLGFLLSSFCLRYYENPFYDPGFSHNDPRWIGAWWIGFLILGVLLLVVSIPMFMFPRVLPGSPESTKQEIAKDTKLPKFKDMPAALMKLIKNKILVCVIIAATLQINGHLGYFVFMPKYMESQYRQSASSASLFSGSTSIIAMVIGILLGGAVIRKFQPRARYLTAYMIFVDIFAMFGLLINMLIGCSPPTMSGTTQINKQIELYNECNANCGCTRHIFEPVCGSDNQSTFFSPCFAGCTGINDTLGSNIFTNCSCAYNSSGYLPPQIENVNGGYCFLDCNMFLPYIIILSFSKFIASTGRVGSAIITLRCVNPEEKSFALGAMGTILSAFAFIPYPLIYGALTDEACVVWEESCGKTGNCWLYDTKKFRYYLHGATILLNGGGIIFHIAIFFMSDRLRDLYNDEEKENEINKENDIAVPALMNPELKRSLIDMRTTV
ncbi:solute carrier organic anion transporter family member 74D-like isoform X2 [Centruroides vittatus]